MTDDPWLKVILFIFRLIPYLLSITGNMIIIILILVDPHLKIPMYFFLRNFSFLEISYTTACIPNLRVMMATGDKNISYSRCVSQVFFVFLPGVSEFYLLAAMFYGHYVAICKPLHYTTIINSKICIQLVFCCWIAGCFTTFVPFLLDLKLFSCLQCCWAFLLWHNCPHADLLLRHTYNWDSGIHFCCNDSCGHISNGDNIIYLHCKSKSKNPFIEPEGKSFYNMFSSHDCDISFLWQLHLHICKTFSPRKNIFFQGNCSAQYLCCPTFESFHLQLTERSENGLHEYDRQGCFFLIQINIIFHFI